MTRPAEVTEYLRCGGVNCDNACASLFDRLGVDDCKTWRVHGYVQQLEERIVHLEALNQQDLSVITMQERTRARLEEQISQLESSIPRWISVDERLPEYGKDHYVLCVVAHKNPEYKGRHVDVYEYDARPLWDGYSPHFDISGWSNAEDLYVTHWMPLPEPPKEV